MKTVASDFFRPLLNPAYWILIALSAAGNLGKAPILFGIDFLFGSIATLIALSFFGPFWAVVSAAIASSYTYFLWGHPYGAISLIAEPMIVGLILLRFRWNLVLASATFWTLFGMPFAWFYGHHLLGIDMTGALMIAAKQGTNGIFNATIAGIALSYAPLLRLFRQGESPRPSLFQTVFYAFMIAALVPALFLVIRDGRSLLGQLESKARGRLDTITTGIEVSVEKWRNHHLAAVNLVADVVEDIGPKDPTQLQNLVRKISASWPEASGVFITDESGKTIAAHPALYENGENHLGIDVSNEPYFTGFKDRPNEPTHAPVFIASAGVHGPVLNVSAPILSGENFLGLASSTVSLEDLGKVLDFVPGESDYHATLIDGAGKVIASNDPSWKPSMPYSSTSPGIVDREAHGYFRRWPENLELPVLARWKRSSIGREVAMKGPGDWKLIVELPIASLQIELYAKYLQRFSLLLGLMFVVVACSFLVASRIARPLAQLSRETTDLPERLKTNETIQWPTSRLFELNALVENFRSVLEALKKRFDDQRAASSKLDETNEILKKQIEEKDKVTEELKEQSRIVELVSQVGLTLKGSLELENLVQAATDAATEMTNAKFGAFFYNILDATGEKYTLYTTSGVPREAFSKFPMPRNTPIFEPTFKGAGIVRMDDVTQSPLFGKNAPYHGMPEGHLPVRSYLAVPVISRTGEVLGGLFFGHPEAGVFTASSEKLVAGIAAQAAVAIDNSRLYEAQKLSESRAKELAATQAFLAEAGRVLGSSLDSKAIKRGLVEVVVPRLADWCAIDIVENDGRLVQFALAHREPEMQNVVDEFFKGPSTVLSPESIPCRVLKSGNPVWLQKATPESFGPRGSDPESTALLETLGIGSVICVPLKARDRVFGILTLVHGDSGREYSEGDLRIAEDLAQRASIAIDHARLYSEAQALNRIKDEFLATLSHELRTPLTAILGHSELLKLEAPELNELASQSVEAIHRNAQSQHQIIADLLDASAIVTGKFSFTPVIFDPNDVTRAAVESIRFAAESKGVELSLNLDSRYCEVVGDPTRLQQVVWNLLSNAVKFTERGGRVIVRTHIEDLNYAIEIQDTGRGIDPEFLPYVFDRFRQEDSSITRKFGGLGLGLSIVRQLVELHGGTIRAQSEGKGKGAAFIVHLPRTQSEFGDNA